MLNAVESTELSVIERIVRGLHTVAKAIEDAPVQEWRVALEAAENSYLDTLRALGFSDVASQALAVAIIRRLKGQLAGDQLTDDEIIDKIRAEVGASDENLAL
jgi:hypothetical protein